uniref:Putative secreted protein n=1 Tax=Anopheles triannulatus TaxID=58253 RepID=A0A2M4B1Y0_9DIPT
MEFCHDWTAYPRQLLHFVLVFFLLRHRVAIDPSQSLIASILDRPTIAITEFARSFSFQRLFQVEAICLELITSSNALSLLLILLAELLSFRYHSIDVGLR